MKESKANEITLIPGDGIGPNVNRVAGNILSIVTKFKGELL
jgi:isocitrate/isopropylmalate dehydrogenase